MKRKPRFCLRLTDSEHQYIKIQAEKAALKTEPYVRALALGYEVKPRPPNEYAALLRTLAGMGNNINQIAKIANTKGNISRKEVQHALQLINQAWERVKTL